VAFGNGSQRRGLNANRGDITARGVRSAANVLFPRLWPALKILDARRRIDESTNRRIDEPSPCRISIGRVAHRRLKNVAYIENFLGESQ